MSADLSIFARIAPYLEHPLVLVGFSIFLFFSLLFLILRLKILPPISSRASSKLVPRIVTFGFVIAILVIVLGFSFEILRVHEGAELNKIPNVIASQFLSARNIQETPNNQEAISTLMGVIEDLLSLKTKPNGDADISAALNSLSKGDSTTAKNVFKELLDKKIATINVQRREASQISADLAALYYFDDLKVANNYYEKSINFDPSNLDAWVNLGRVKYELGDWAGAELAWKQVIARGRSRQDFSYLFNAYTQLAFEMMNRGDGEKSKVYMCDLQNLLNSRSEFVAANGGKRFSCNFSDEQFASAVDYKKDLQRKVSSSLKKARIEQSDLDSFVQLGNIYIAEKSIANAHEILYRAMNIANQFHYSVALEKIYMTIGGMYYAQNDLDDAGFYYRSAIRLCSIRNNWLCVAECYAEMGNVFYMAGMDGNAEAIYKRSLALYQKFGFEPGVATVATNLKYIYKNSKDNANYKKMQAVANAAIQNIHPYY